MKNTIESDKLWDAYDAAKKVSKNKEQYIKETNALIEFYYPVVIKLATRMHCKNRSLSIEEMTSYGIDGLYQAIDKFDRSRSIIFETYATLRIKGSIIDNIRKVDWVPRLVRYRNNKLNKIKQKLNSSLGREVTDEDIASEMNLTLSEYDKFKSDETPLFCLSIDAKIGNSNDEDDKSYDIYAVESSEEDPLSKVLKTEMCHKLLGKSFTKTERKIMYLHYYEDMNFKEISKEVNFSESRISQMHSNMLDRLRRKMERNPEYTKELEFMLGK